jgi:hypothetical protein
LLATLLILVGVLRIASTFRVFAETADEANHIKASLEIYQFHRYEAQTWNPPLPRLIFGIAPYLGGMRYDPSIMDFGKGLHFVFYGHGKYEANLVRARVGNLVFFVVAAAGLWLLARRYFDEKGALLALLLFTTQPVVLGYSGLATHDTPGLAGVAMALAAFARWLDKPDWKRATVLGLAYGFAALCKFSCIAFVPAACGAVFVLRLIHDQALRRSVWRALATISVVPVAGFLTVWAGYGFTVGPYKDFAHVPAPKFWDGLFGILQLDAEGFLCYAWGRTSWHGWWWYFPSTVLLKTTLAALILLVIGAWFAWRSPAFRWTWAEWALATLLIFVPSMRSSLDLGVRYVLPVYVALTIAAAAAAMAMLRSGKRPVRYAAMLLLAWHLVASTLAHPDYFPYFNELAARHPSHFLIDSNLDWGQDILRLRRFCRQRGITVLPRAIFTIADLDALGLAAEKEINWDEPPMEPTALSETALVAARMRHPDAFPWADKVRYIRVGKTIRIYGAAGTAAFP